MTKVDPEIRARLERASAWWSIDSERALARVHSRDLRHARSRRTASFAIAGALLTIIVVALVSRRSSHDGFVQSGGEPGGRIAFARRVDGNGANALWAVDLASESQSPIAAGLDSTTAAAWSPDGSSIAYTVEEDAGARYALVVARADGSLPVKIVEHQKAEGTLGPDFVSVAWSPDGSHLAYSSRTIYRGRTVTVMARDGSDARVLDGLWLSVSWSPDGAHLLLLGRPDPSVKRGGGIYRVNADGSDPVRLIASAGDLTESGASWSPDGTKITFVRPKTPGDNANTDIYIMNADGSDVRRLTGDRSFNAGPVWSPDGEWIAFASDRDAPPTGNVAPSRSSIYVMRPDGSDVQRLFDGGRDVAFPLSWTQ